MKLMSPSERKNRTCFCCGSKYAKYFATKLSGEATDFTLCNVCIITFEEHLRHGEIIRLRKVRGESNGND